MTGFPIRIVESGGIPVTQVQGNAPIAQEAESGVAVMLVDSGTPLIINGLVPPQPFPPGPDNRNVELIDSENPVVIPYNKLYAVTIIRIDCLNASGAAMPEFSATWGALPFTVVAEVGNESDGSPVCAFLYLDNPATGSQNITISAVGAATLASVRTGPLVSMSGIGSVQNSVAAAGIADIDFVPQSAGNGLLSQQACFDSDLSFPVSQSYGADTQYTSYQVVLGSEVLTNGDFSVDPGPWTWTGNWSISGGVATRTGVGGTIIQQAISPSVGRYQLSFDIVVAVGTMQAFRRNSNAYTSLTSAYDTVGTKTPFVYLNAGVTGFGIQGVANGTGSSIDNVSLKPVTGGISVWFGTQETPTAQPLTYEAANASDNPGHAVLLVEIIGGVAP